ncbi:MAG TPA: TRAP transporter substrate-binding protein [Thermoanaerobaculia bacterium]|nr:TRAP transporter substrate-binding protein [Thermoanaerobaculia bacterium]
MSCRAPANGASVLTLAHGLDVTHPVHRAMEHLAARLAELSDGALRAEIFPGEQLGSERECLELLQIGSLSMTKVSASVLESFAPAFAVFSIPYLFRDRAHERTVLDGAIGRELLVSAERFRLRGLAYYDAGSRSFYTRSRAIAHPDDLAGLKIRTQESPSAIRMVQLLGGSATPISWGELYTALQQGVVDGAENNPPSFHLSHHYEVCRWYSLDEHTAVPDVLLIGTPTWNELGPRERAWLEEAAGESAVVQTELWRAATEEALAEVQAAGVEVSRPDKGPFAERVAPFREEMADDPVLGGWVRRVVALAS